MRIFHRAKKETLLEKDNKNNNRPIKVVKEGEHSWRILYDESPEALNGTRKTMTLQDLLKSASKK